MNQKTTDDWGLWIIVLAVAVWFFFFRDTDCKQYASKFSCDFVEKKATYDVYYWLDLDRAETERYIGSSVGLAACEATAIGYAASVGQRWNERRYICVLKKEGLSLEKHRYMRLTRS